MLTILILCPKTEEGVLDNVLVIKQTFLEVPFANFWKICIDKIFFRFFNAH